MSSVESPGIEPSARPLRDPDGAAARGITEGVPGRKRGLTWPAVSVLTDALALAAAVVTSQVVASSAGGAGAPVIWLAVFPATVLAFAYLRGSYRQTLTLQVLERIRAIATVTAIATVAVIALRVIVADDPGAASQTLRLAAFSVVYLGAANAGLIWAQRQARKGGRAARRTLIVGAGHVGTHAARRLIEHPEFGLRPIGFLDKDPLDDEERGGLAVFGASWDLERIIDEQHVEHVVVSFSTAPHHVLLRIVERCEALGVSVSLVPRLFEKVTGRIVVEHLGGLPLLEIRRPDPAGWQFAVKYALDRLGALAGLLIALPILAPSAVAVLTSLGRPILYKQERVGLDGRPFQILKFRTMRPPNPSADNVIALAPRDTAPGGVEGQDRRTRVGTLLRRTSVDELPQLVNVLKGEMSLIGPRPERPEFARLFAARVDRYAERHRVKSGITGWAQVHGLRGKTSLSDRVEWDNYYIENWSLWLDFKILILTVAAVVRPGRVE